jgi:outer membrane protein insertion porin family
LETRNKISEIQALDNVNITTIGFDRQDEEVELLVGVNEKRPYVFELGAGYDTERLLYSDILINNRNFAGLNLNIEAKAELSNIGYKIDGSVTDQFFASFPVSSTTGISVETREDLNKNFGTRIWGASQNFSGNFQDKQVNINLGLSYENRQQYLTGAFDTYDRENESERSVITVGPGLILKTTDSPVTPKKGIFLTTNLTVSKGMENNTDDFIKYRLDARYYYSPLNSLTFAARSAFNLIRPYGGNNWISEDQLFYLGGASTVRGFGENLLRRNADGPAIGGRESMFSSLEARYDTGMNVNLSLFYDIGKVSNIPDYQEPESFRDSLGIGLRYMTPIGLIGIVYGHKLNPTTYESRGAFHFSMGYSF